MQGDTLSLWECLASLGAVDLTVARVAEPHLDALAILREARRHGQVRDEDWQARSPDWSAARLWQVYAAEGGERLVATETGDGWTLTGLKPWCSLADRATHALVTAWVDDDQRGLFAVDLEHADVSPPEDPAGQSAQWAARGLDQVRSTPIAFDHAPAVADLPAAVVPHPARLLLGRHRRRRDLVRRLRRAGPYAPRRGRAA